MRLAAWIAAFTIAGCLAAGAALELIPNAALHEARNAWIWLTVLFGVIGVAVGSAEEARARQLAALDRLSNR